MEPERVRHSLQVCQSLDEAHGAGLVHRDISRNIMLCQIGLVRLQVLDFGLVNR